VQVINYTQVVIGVGIVFIGFDRAVEVLVGRMETLHLQLGNADLIE
jgi:hypothetical protein